MAREPVLSMTTTIQSERIQHLNDRPIRAGDHVLYWMQQSQRAEYNHALEYAVQQANELSQPVQVVFGLMDDYPEANLRHYRFMLEGLRDAQTTLADRGIPMSIRRGHPANVAVKAGRSASLMVCDRGYQRHQRRWRHQVGQDAGCRVVQVESDVVVPVDIASNKAEFAARTLRPKLHRHLKSYLVGLRETRLHHRAHNKKNDGLDLSNLDAVLASLKIDRSVEPVAHLHQGGTTRAKARFRDFIRHRLDGYREQRNQPHLDHVSHMSMYLHFGQVSPLYLALQVQQAEDKHRKDTDSFLEELIVRRELGINFVYFSPKYDSFECIPRWAQETLHAHRKDTREHVYSRSQLETADTHDPYWNAACREMLLTGYMQNHMRMYWGKKILEWSRTPEDAHAVTLAIMNKYFLDARDPNSYSNVAWLFGLHDRPWGERPIFGTVRYMAASGLKRKTDIDAYVRKIEALE